MRFFNRRTAEQKWEGMAEDQRLRLFRGIVKGCIAGCLMAVGSRRLSREEIRGVPAALFEEWITTGVTRGFIETMEKNFDPKRSLSWHLLEVAKAMITSLTRGSANPGESLLRMADDLRTRL